MYKMSNRNFDLNYSVGYDIPDSERNVASVLKALLAYLICAAGLTLVSGSVASLPFRSIWTMEAVVSFVYYPLCCILPVVLFTRARGRGAFETLRPNPLRFSTALLIALLALICVFFANELSVLWSLPFDAAGFDIYVGSMEAPETVGELLLAIVTVGLMPGVCEELLFRGFIQPAFEEKGTKRAAVLVALLFAVLHGSVIGFPVQFILGLIMAVLVILTDSLYASAFFHAVYNSALVLLMYIQGKTSLESSVPGQLFSDIGGVFGVITLIIGVLQLGAAVFFILFAMRRRAKRRGLRIVERQPLRLRGGEIALLCGGLSFVLLYYVLDVVSMLGVL